MSDARWIDTAAIRTGFQFSDDSTIEALCDEVNRLRARDDLAQSTFDACCQIICLIGDDSRCHLCGNLKRREHADRCPGSIALLGMGIRP